MVNSAFSPIIYSTFKNDIPAKTKKPGGILNTTRFDNDFR